VFNWLKYRRGIKDIGTAVYRVKQDIRASLLGSHDLSISDERSLTEVVTALETLHRKADELEQKVAGIERNHSQTTSESPNQLVDRWTTT